MIRFSEVQEMYIFAGGPPGSVLYLSVHYENSFIIAMSWFPCLWSGKNNTKLLQSYCEELIRRSFVNKLILK